MNNKWMIRFLKKKKYILIKDTLKINNFITFLSIGTRLKSVAINSFFKGNFKSSHKSSAFHS